MYTEWFLNVVEMSITFGASQRPNFYSNHIIFISHVPSRPLGKDGPEVKSTSFLYFCTISNGQWLKHSPQLLPTRPGPHVLALDHN